MADMRDALLAKQQNEARLEESRRITQAVTVAVDFTDSPEVAGRPGWVWVQEYAQPGSLFQVFNRAAGRVVGLPVLIAVDPKQPFRRKVIDVDDSVLPDWPDYAGETYLVNHGEQHQIPDGRPGFDGVLIYTRALVSLRTQPKSGLVVRVAYHRYEYNGALVTFGGSESVDLTASVPASGLARYTLVYLDRATNAVGTVDGGTTIDSLTVGPPVPTPPANCITSALVRLAGGQTAVRELDIVDWRLLLNATGGAGEFARIVVHGGDVVTHNGEVVWR